MVQSKGKKSSVNFKYYALENWLLSLTSNRLSSTAGHFPAKASLESLDRSGMLCKLWRKERQKGESRASTILHIILLLSGKLQNGRKIYLEALLNRTSDFLFQKASPQKTINDDRIRRMGAGQETNGVAQSALSKEGECPFLVEEK